MRVAQRVERSVWKAARGSQCVKRGVECDACSAARGAHLPYLNRSVTLYRACFLNSYPPPFGNRHIIPKNYPIATACILFDGRSMWNLLQTLFFEQFLSPPGLNSANEFTPQLIRIFWSGEKNEIVQKTTVEVFSTRSYHENWFATGDRVRFAAKTVPETWTVSYLSTGCMCFDRNFD